MKVLTCGPCEVSERGFVWMPAHILYVDTGRSPVQYLVKLDGRDSNGDIKLRFLTEQQIRPLPSYIPFSPNDCNLSEFPKLTQQIMHVSSTKLFKITGMYVISDQDDLEFRLCDGKVQFFVHPRALAANYVYLTTGLPVGKRS